MRVWVDDARPAPPGYMRVRSVNETIDLIQNYELMKKVSGGKKYYDIELIDLDHDAGEYAKDGGDYINILNWLEETGRNYPIRIHSANPVGVENMRRIIKRNGWKEIMKVGD